MRSKQNHPVLRNSIRLCQALFCLALISWPATTARADDEVKVGGDIRGRTEYKRPYNYVASDGGEPTGDDGTSLRTRLHFHWTPAENVEFFMQVQDSRFWGTDSVVDMADADLDLRQAYVTLNNLQSHGALTWLGENDLDVKIGRMALPTFGDGYIISSNEWEVNGPIAFEGLWFMGNFGSDEFAVDVDLLWMDLANNDPTGGGAIGPAEDTVFWGFNAGTGDIPWIGAEVYYWTMDRPKGVDEMTYGWRITTDIPEDNPLAGLRGVFEYAIASGERGLLDVDANFWVVRGEYDFNLFDLPHTVGVGFSHATGSAASASDNETWSAPLDLTHETLGHFDLVDNSNVDDLFFQFQVAPTDQIDLHIDFHMFTLDEENGGWATASGGTVGAGGAILDDDLGTDIDIYAVCQVMGDNELRFGYSRFEAGDAVKDATGGFDDAGDYLYLQVLVPFGTAAN